MVTSGVLSDTVKISGHFLSLHSGERLYQLKFCHSHLVIWFLSREVSTPGHGAVSDTTCGCSGRDER